MSAEDFDFRLAGLSDAGTIAAIVTETADGLVEELLGGLVPSLSSADLLALAFGQGEGVYRPENVILAESGGETQGLLFSYPSDQQGLPGLARHYLPQARLNRLTDVLCASVPETLWINTVWVAESNRGRGLGGCLLELAESRAERQSLAGIGLFAWAAAKDALALYDRCGLEVVRPVAAADPPVQGRGGPHGQGGLILAKFRSESP
jgi:GNAT superfamily N-acetyltransferase